MDLKEIRNQIDRVDDEILRLFLRRMELCSEVAEYKARTGMAVLDAGREQEILSRVARNSPGELGEYSRQLFDRLFQISRSYQDAKRTTAEQTRDKTTQNIVLVGMPGSGKTAIGAALAASLGRRLVDTDEVIAESTGMSIPDLFAEKGEAYFRELERRTVRELGAKSGLIISTGGGVPMDERNHGPLRENGRVYYIERPLDQLATDGRPLSSSRQALETLLRQRESAYRAISDCRIPNTGSIEEDAELIRNDFLNR